MVCAVVGEPRKPVISGEWRVASDEWGRKDIRHY
jgi:hypothetical protein